MQDTQEPLKEQWGTCEPVTQEVEILELSPFFLRFPWASFRFGFFPSPTLRGRTPWRGYRDSIDLGRAFRVQHGVTLWLQQLSC